MTTAHILAFAGSSRRDSWNRKVLGVAVDGAREAGAEVTVVNLRDYPMPIYDADWHAEYGVPPPIRYRSGGHTEAGFIPGGRAFTRVPAAPHGDRTEQRRATRTPSSSRLGAIPRGAGRPVRLENLPHG